VRVSAKGAGGLRISRRPFYGLPSALRLLETALFAIGVVAVGWCLLTLVRSRLDQAGASRELDRKIAAARAARSFAPARRPAAALRALPAPGSVVGELSIPRLGLSAIAREGTDSGTLRGAIGHVPGTALPPDNGNAAFAAHRDTFFRGLGRLRANDELRLKSPEGTFLYRVAWTRIVEPEATWVLEPQAEGSLTLVTCYPFNYVGPAPKRFVVRASLAQR
jgi:sortase A